MRMMSLWEMRRSILWLAIMDNRAILLMRLRMVSFEVGLDFLFGRPGLRQDVGRRDAMEQG